MRTIIHVDLDAFYSAIEQRDNPELHGRPVVVGGDPDGRGVVATASYEARRYGVRSAMACSAARRLCPEAIFLRPRFAVYSAVSEEIMHMLREIGGSFEQLSLDEAFLDVTDRMTENGDPEALGRAIKRRIRERTDLTASLGIAANKLTAKVASDYQKPDGLTVVPPGQERQFLAPLRVRALWGIGPKAEERLALAGVKTVSQLADADEAWVVARFGRWGLEWQRLALGIDGRAVMARSGRRQVSRERTFPQDVMDREEVIAAVRLLARELQGVLETYPPCKTLTLKLRYADFTTVTRRHTSRTVMTPESLTSLASYLLETHWNGRPVRLLGLGLSNFVEQQPGQLALL